MRCPFCGHAESQVKDSRPSEDGAAIRRRRLCPECGGRFTTFERVQLRELTILKRSGRRAPFDREKLVRSISVAIRKRPVDPERVERMVNAIVRQLESMGETELASHVVGEMVMKALKSLDDVAYVRYASVYRDFRQTEDFADFLSDEGLANDGRPTTTRTNEGHPQAGDLARRQDRHRVRREPLDHRRGARRKSTGCGCRTWRCWSASRPRSPTTRN